MASALPTPGHASSTSESRLDRDSVEWLHGLRAGGRRRTEAEARLHALLLQIARRKVNRRRGQLPTAGPELDDLAHQAAADALMAIVAKLDDFRGVARAHGRSAPRRRRGPTAHQRRIFVAIVLNGVPADALAAKLDTNRNAICRTMFDARRKIRAALVANGHLDPQISRPQ